MILIRTFNFRDYDGRKRAELYPPPLRFMSSSLEVIKCCVSVFTIILIDELLAHIKIRKSLTLIKYKTFCRTGNGNKMN